MLLLALHFKDAYQPDVFHAHLANDKIDFCRRCASAWFLRQAPRWWRDELSTARSFVILPLMLIYHPVASCYGDWDASAATSKIAQQEVVLLDELRGAGAKPWPTSPAGCSEPAYHNHSKRGKTTINWSSAKPPITSNSLARLREAGQAIQVAIHAMCLMPDHPAICWRRRADQDDRKYERSGTLWQGRYKATVVDAERYLMTCCRYIETNPVRGGLAAAAGDIRGPAIPHHIGLKSDPVITESPLYWALGNTPFERRLRRLQGIG
ncbi:hypothetical protein FQR65_LT20277 [Abscondita terminalis]|nr:hypothetical protein FQR65_LT20277 [Abscondita terminalis]